LVYSCKGLYKFTKEVEEFLLSTKKHKRKMYEREKLIKRLISIIPARKTQKIKIIIYESKIIYTKDKILKNKSFNTTFKRGCKSTKDKTQGQIYNLPKILQINKSGDSN